MKTMRCVLLVVLLLLTASAAAPAAAAAPGGSPGWSPSWWQGATAWLAERLPFVGWLTAADEDDGTAPEDDGTAPPEDDGSTHDVEPLDGDGDEDEGGPIWDPNGGS